MSKIRKSNTLVNCAEASKIKPFALTRFSMIYYYCVLHAEGQFQFKLYKSLIKRIYRVIKIPHNNEN